MKDAPMIPTVRKEVWWPVNEKKLEYKTKKLEYKRSAHYKDIVCGWQIAICAVVAIVLFFGLFIYIAYLSNTTPAEAKQRHEEKIICIQEHGTWVSNRCNFYLGDND